MEAYKQLCREAGEASAHIAIAWLLHQPAVAAPIIGPRTVRHGIGFVVDTVASVQWQLDKTTQYTLFALEVIVIRAALLRAEELITGDRYIFIRDAYLQQREYFVNDGVVDDAFSDSHDDFDWYE